MKKSHISYIVKDAKLYALMLEKMCLFKLVCVSAVLCDLR